MAEVALRNVVKRFDDVEAVRSIDLDIPNNEFVVLVGPSGCGKSTTLRMIAGLEEVTSGDIYIGGELVNDLPPKDRDIAMVFQNYALYPHMTAYENMSFGLRLRKFAKAEIRQRVEHAARILDITDLLDRRPKALSGGQRQRVAMGRAIVRNPKVFLFDEPLSNLDAKLRVQMRTEIKRVHQKVKTTTVYVTHDQVEAMTLADRVVVMNKGRIEQIGTPQELYHQPRTRFVAGFIGSPAMNFIPCRLEQQRRRPERARLRRRSSCRCRRSHAPRYQAVAGRELILGLRPEHITEPRRSEPRGGCEFAVTLDVVEPMGMETMVFFTVNGQEVCGRVDPAAAKGPGEPMRLARERRAHASDRPGDRPGGLGAPAPRAGPPELLSRPRVKRTGGIFAGRHRMTEITRLHARARMLSRLAKAAPGALAARLSERAAECLRTAAERERELAAHDGHRRAVSTAQQQQQTQPQEEGGNVPPARRR